MSGDGTVGKALDVLDQVAGFGRPVRFGTLLEASPFPKATLYRFLQTLTSQRMLAYDPENQTYSLGMRLVGLAHMAVGLGNAARRDGRIHRAQFHRPGVGCRRGGPLFQARRDPAFQPPLLCIEFVCPVQGRDELKGRFVFRFFVEFSQLCSSLMVPHRVDHLF